MERVKIKKQIRSGYAVKAIIVLLLFLFTGLAGNGRRDQVVAQVPQTETLSVSVSGTYQRSGTYAILPFFNHSLILNGNTVTVGTTVNGNFGYDYNVTYGQVILTVSYKGTIVGSTTGNFSSTGPVSFPTSSFTVPVGATMDDLDFGYQSYYGLQFTTPSFTQSFHYSDYYSSGRTYDGGIISGNERYDLNITRPCAQVASFTATPTTVPAGNPVTLQWVVNNRFRSIVRIYDLTHNTVIGDFPSGAGQTTVNPTATTTFQIRLVDGSGNPVGCFSTLTIELVVSSGTQYFWIIKRLPEDGVNYPPGAPPIYTEPPAGTPAPGGNDPNSYRLVPEDGSTFSAPSPETAQTLEPYLSTRDSKQIEMIISDSTLPGGSQSPNALRALDDYNSARRMYRGVLLQFNSQTPGYTGPKQGAGSPRNLAVPKWNEKVDPWK
jgi:hypothetical protein